MDDAIGTVLEDLRIYCEKEKLVETEALVALAKTVYASESQAMIPSPLSLYDHLVAANQRH